MSKSSTSNGNGFSATNGKVITCKAAVAWGPKQPMVIQDVEVEPPRRMEVRIRVTHVSLCHTDITFWQVQDMDAFPRIFGHEAAGVVESVGEGVEEFKEGDHVLPLFSGECGNCEYCNKPRHKTNICGRFMVEPMRLFMRSDETTRFSALCNSNRIPVHHFFSSAFSQYTVVDSACLVKIHPQAPLNEICLTSCCIATGLGAVWKNAKVERGSTVAVFGLGAVGLAVVEGAAKAGAARIIGIETNPQKFAKARSMGATDLINPRDEKRPIEEVIREMCDGGVDYSFECVGNAEVIRQAFFSTHHGWGVAILVGIDPTPKSIELKPMDLFEGRRLEGSTFGGFRGKSELPDLVQKCMNGEIKVREYITHELPFENINDAFHLLMSGNCLRCVLTL